MTKYQVGVAPFVMPEWAVGRTEVQPYLLCLDCGQLWTEDIQGTVHLLKEQHTGPASCPADKRSAERYDKSLLGQVLPRIQS